MSQSHMRFGVANSLSNSSSPSALGGKQGIFNSMGSGQIGPPSTRNCMSLDFNQESEKFKCSAPVFKESLRFFSQNSKAQDEPYIELKQDLKMRLLNVRDDQDNPKNIPGDNCTCDLENKRLIGENFWMRLNIDHSQLSQRNTNVEQGIKLKNINTEQLNSKDTGPADSNALKPFVAFEKESLPQDELMRIGNIDPEQIQLKEEEMIKSIVFQFPKKFRIDMSHVQRQIEKQYNIGADECSWTNTEVQLQLKSLQQNESLRTEVLKLIRTTGEEFKMKTQQELNKMNENELFRHRVIKEQIDNYLFSAMNQFKDFGKCLQLLNTRTLYLFEQKKE